MKKSLFLLFAFLLLFPMISLANPNSEDDKGTDAYNEVKQSVYDTLNEKENDLLDRFEDDEKVQEVVFENYHYAENGKISLKISDLDEFSEETGMDVKTSDEYIKTINKVLDIVNEKQAEQIELNGVETASNTKCDYTKEILKNFTYESNYCKKNTEKILDNISNKSKILGGISLAGFWNPYVSISSGLGSLFSSVKHDKINGYFRDSGYKGVINRVVKVPGSPDGSYWRPLGTKWDGANPEP